MVNNVKVSGGVPRPTGEPSSGETPHRFGLTAAMALIVSGIIGVGRFNLLTSLAVHGSITLVSMTLTTVGALALALLLASPSRSWPACRGLYVHARAAAVPHYPETEVTRTG